jgi:hypothetical protein
MTGDGRSDEEPGFAAALAHAERDRRVAILSTTTCAHVGRFNEGAL